MSVHSSNQSQNITIWITPMFHPNPATSAGALLAERLAAFEQANPDISINVRLKDENGPGGLLKTLMAARYAAPSALPDVVALNPVSLDIGAMEELIIPLDGLIERPDTPEWYDHALAVTHVDGIFFGIPFASEADVLAYKIDQYPSSPYTWADILAEPASFVFTVDDPDATFTLTQYLAHEGPILDDDGQLTIDTTILGDVLTFYEAANSSNILPSGGHQYASTTETWTALRNGLTASAVTSLSLFMTEGDLETTFAIPLPTRNESGICPAKTWSWAIVTSDPTRQSIVSQLLTWLTQPEFLGPWTHALGMLPPTKSGLSYWPEGVETAIVSNLVTVAQPEPFGETLANFGPPLHTAVKAVLDGMTPSSAALAAAQAIQNP
jgi:ABC-type glycerol-3-phosphate transport system substrate-binding protein